MKRFSLLKEQICLNKTSKKEKIEISKNTIEKSSYLKEMTFPYENELRDYIYKELKNDIFRKPDFSNVRENRDYTFNSFKSIGEIMNNGKFKMKEIRQDLFKFSTFIESISALHAAISIRTLVHLSLYYFSIKNLGTEKHTKYLDDCTDYKDYGCFSMTEFEHGSNVRMIKTTAVYNKDTNKFILNSNGEKNYKWWIGGVAENATMTVVFARLIVNNKDCGVAPFIVRIRNKPNSESISSSIILGDCGKKIGNNGVDNGFIGFINHEIEYDMLLDKFSKIDKNGNFSSEIKSNNVRFALVLGALEEGRAIIPNLCCVRFVFIRWDY